jgi:hypothetical protein
MVARLLATGQDQLRASVAQTYSRILAAGLYNDDDIVIFRTLLADGTAWIAQIAIQALTGALPKEKADLTVELARFANIGGSHVLADELLTAFTFNQLFDHLAVGDVEAILEKLMAVPKLDGHWIEEFLAQSSKAFPKETMAFFMRRVERAAENEDWNYRPANHGPYGHIPLRFRDSEAYSELLRTVAEWMRSGKGKPALFGYRARELFECSFGPFDAETVLFLEEWIATSDDDDLRLIGDIIGETDHTFVFIHRPFVERFLDKAKQIGPKALKRAIGSLFGSAIGGIRSGTPGEPMPRDIEMKEESEKILQSLPRFSPAFELYDGFRKHAERGIADSRRERDAFED